MVWSCSATATSRARLDFLTSAERDSMPVCLSRWGIAPSVSLACTGPPWAAPPGSDDVLPFLLPFVVGVAPVHWDVWVLGEALRGPTPSYFMPSFTAVCDLNKQHT
eukprot:7655320-Alexandrium_andersonii.AAC.1